MFFASPDRLYWLLALIPMAAAAGGYFYWRSRVRETIGDPETVDELTDATASSLRWVRTGLMLAGTALLVVAAAEPRWGMADQQIERRGVDLVYALDLSKSMLARDAAPTRLEAATGEMKSTLERLDGDRVGLVVYTTVSFVQSPLTTDYSALRFYLDKLDPSQMSVGGTAIGDAIRDSVELLTGKSIGSEDSQATRSARDNRAATQVVVLMTDGEDHQTNPVEAARTAREHGIRIVTVGLGAKSGSKIPILDDEGNVEGYKRNDEGEVVTSRLEADQLRKIANAGGGTYLRYRGDGSVANELSSFVNQLESSRLEAEQMERYHDRFHWFLVPAVLLLLAAFLVGERRSGRLDWSAGNAALFAVLLAAAGSSGCDDTFREQHPTVRAGNAHVESGEWKEALDAYDRAAEELPEVPASLHYNRGRAQLGRDEYADARSAFGRALASGDASIRFDAHYGIGLTFSREESWKRAAAAYRRAMAVYATDTDAISESAVAAARHNLELTYRKLYPPCHLEEDEFEENDGPENAARWKPKGKPNPPKGGGRAKGDGADRDLTLCGGDDDWFAIDAVPGATVSVEATFRTLGEQDDPHHDFLPRPEDLRLEIYGADGDRRLIRDRGDPGGEPPPEGGPVTREIAEWTVPKDAPVGAEGRLLVRLSAADQLKFDYDLDVQVTPPCRELQESSESNDSRDRAASLDSGKHRGQICGGDTDWYRVDIPRARSVFVDVRPMQRKSSGRTQSSDGDERRRKLDVRMVDASSGEPMGNVRREGPYWTGGIQENRTKRTMAVGVTGAKSDVETPYRVRVYDYGPCMEGDDRYEPNDALNEAATPKSKSRHLRYLRLCPKDEDFFAFKPPKRKSASGQPGGSSSDKRVRLGLTKVPRTDDSKAELDLEAIDPASGDPKKSARPPSGDGSNDDSRDESDSDSRSDSPVDLALSAKPPKSKERLPVRVRGEAGFYHLARLPSGGGDGQNDRKNQKNDDKKNNQKRSSNDSKSDKKRKKDRRRKKRKKKSKKSRQKKAPKKQKKKRGKQKKTAKKKKRKLDESDRDILRALRQSDKNFQMQQSTEENRQEGAVEKDW